MKGTCTAADELDLMLCRSPVALRGGTPWSSAMTVTLSVVSSVTLTRSEVKLKAPVALFKAKYGEVSPQNLQRTKENLLIRKSVIYIINGNTFTRRSTMARSTLEERFVQENDAREKLQ